MICMEYGVTHAIRGETSFSLDDYNNLRDAVIDAVAIS
jgi:hypothetical protein